MFMPRLDFSLGFLYVAVFDCGVHVVVFVKGTSRFMLPFLVKQGGFFFGSLDARVEVGWYRELEAITDGLYGITLRIEESCGPTRR